MPNNSESRPPILDYQPVTKDCRRIPTWVVVFLVGFTVGVIWMLAALWQYSELSAPGWGIILACPRLRRWRVVSVERDCGVHRRLLDARRLVWAAGTVGLRCVPKTTAPGWRVS